MKKRKILSGLICSIMAISATLSCFSASVGAVDEQDAFIDLNQSQITEAMGAGWNLGNQLEAANAGVPSETAYGNPVIKKELIQAVKAAGFKSIRIPVSYLKKIGEAPNYTIDADWLNRVKEVVDYAIDEGLYVIVNMHGDGYYTVDGGWLLCAESDDKQVEIKAKYQACWEQIATLFKDYDEHLIFESMNEEFDGKYSGQNFAAYKNINAYNQIFVDTVRNTGSNNAKRWLLVPGWNTNIDQTVNPQGGYSFEIPTDSNLDKSVNGKRIMVSVHYYDPWDFSGDGTSDSYSQWGNDANPSKRTSYSYTEEYMEGQIKKVYEKFVKEGYPVVIGEYGCINKSASDPLNTMYRAYYDKTLCEFSKEYGCIPVYWDNGAVSNSFGLFNRNNYKIEQPEIIDAMMSVYLTPQENLDRIINVVSKLDGKCYTSETKEQLDTALTSAKSITESGTATDEQYEEAYNALSDAYYALMPSENYLQEQVLITDKDVADSENIEAADGLFLSVQPSNLNVKSSKLITFKFKVVSGTPNTADNLFVLKPFSNNNLDGWTDNFVTLSDCTYDSSTGEYTVTVDPQTVLESYANSPNGHSDPNGANSINIYYMTKGTSTNIQLTYCSFSFIAEHSTHHYVLKEETDASCTDAHIRTYECTACGETYTETISKAKGHKYVDGVCTVCGEKDPNYVAPTAPTNPNPTNPGSSKPTTKTPAKTTTAVSKTTRNTAVVAKEKKAAEKAMKQAKITKLTVKSKAKKKITVTWKKVKKAVGYEVEISTNKKFKKNKTVLTKTTAKKKLVIKNKKLKSGKKYFVRVRAYATYKNANGTAIKVYSNWNKKLRKVTVK